MLILEIYLAVAVISFIGLTVVFWGEDVQVHHALLWAALWPAYVVAVITILIGCFWEARKP